ncbi:MULTISPECIES: arsenite S-adenosylmethionine methyltransferase [Bacillus]|uniref:ArsM n=1 Tax=Bacillus sp. CX-1 TaxID=2045018 RepID=A0A2P1M875_9BACI|nr:MULTISPECIES: arsenite S-adenosylmethionine methyltransferase [Bacillus]AVP26577.1 ArsM [Bacillus sp. CX-1]MBA1163643.1 methyltransferase domain-containing protein [Bacillus licheniformis]MBS2762857.1 methyltransferase domain-containing protein [Bacillus licheniformis]PAK33583.1 type 11 methyltransferase [Bacillus licheniformis]TWK57275.1 Demethylrebeccamycin-D-glucose O-methyltransferase [Bacillus licheniformis]
MSESNFQTSCCSPSTDNGIENRFSAEIYNFYDSVAKGDGPYNLNENKFSPSAPTKKILEYITANDKKRILDMGSGMGTTLIDLTKKHESGQQFIGIDFSENMIAKSRENSKKLDEKLQKKIGFFKGNLDDLPFMDKQFDFVYSECVMNLVSDREKVVSEAYRVLETGGLFVYTDFVSFKPVSEDVKYNEGLVCGCRGGSISLSENIKILENQGFRNIESIDFSIDKDKRDQYLRLEHDAIRKEHEKLVKENPDVAKFIDEELGYYLICGKK